MGRILQRTAVSTNIKERLDFSCALFGPDGGLVSNAPHIPVHLGAMQEAVQFQIRNLGPELREGDVILSNHPRAGGSHLPDLTVITPVFWPGVARPVFFVASRGHHADVGGCTPGSMPPHSRALREEGAVFVSFKLVTGGRFQEQAVTEALLAPGAIPGCSGTRNLRDNLADLRAQVAANQKGIGLVRELIGQHGLGAVQAYMGYVQANAEVAVRDTLRAAAARWGTALGAEDTMDDGTPIRLRVQLDPKEGSAVFDFRGTGPEVLGNCNAPRAITLSALIYCLRCLVGHEIPLNQGCLAPVRVLIPGGSILDPSPEAAVVGGNVLTSQRVVDVVLRAFGACAASQGCMNNVTFGSERGGYYETVAGGAGAGPRWGGRSGVHTHMTNTRITDPEILELRYPVVLRRFELRGGSGGAGRHRGGDGVVRELQFRRATELSVLSERRATRPYGMAGRFPPADPGWGRLRPPRGRHRGRPPGPPGPPGPLGPPELPEAPKPRERPERPGPTNVPGARQRLRVPAGAGGRVRQLWGSPAAPYGAAPQQQQWGSPTTPYGAAPQPPMGQPHSNNNGAAPQLPMGKPHNNHGAAPQLPMGQPHKSLRGSPTTPNGAAPQIPKGQPHNSQWGSPTNP
ncbi:5-oxoprolinase isoform X2 [Corvus moneduloides]|uniref:5-oxoprolinase isoform X2 n=1 Tax=Corvus moneduloides TaxID=1196302 RepID=UPI001362A49F|nr:5-oxoprolinase isoform X2 [Corvus moneduloides]